MTNVDLARILDQLADVRTRCPELRFGQLIAIVGELAKDETGHSLWDVEDVAFAEALERFAGDVGRAVDRGGPNQPAHLITAALPGRPKASGGVIVGVQDEDEIERLLMAYSPRLQAILEKSRKQIRNGEVLSHEEFWKEVEAPSTPPRRGGKRKARR